MLNTLPRAQVLEQIRQRLEVLEAEKNISVIFAAEMGSRAWGFPSPDSDYDIHFIYTHPLEGYLQLDTPSQVIEFKEGLVEFVGWDIRKTLGLLRRSHPAPLEMLSSIAVINKTDLLLKAATACHSPMATYSRHASMVDKTMRRFIDGNKMFPLKKYLHCLRSALTMDFASRSEAPPPLDITRLCLELAEELNPHEDYSELYTHVVALVEQRGCSMSYQSGGQLVAGSEVIDEYIAWFRARAVYEPVQGPSQTRNSTLLSVDDKTSLLNALFRKTVMPHLNLA